MTLGKKIEEYRKKAKLSQSELANQLYISRQTVSQWENDLTTPTMDNLRRLCEVFGLSLQELLDQDGVTDKEPECAELYKWHYSQEELRDVFRMVRKDTDAGFVLAFGFGIFVLLISFIFQFWTGVSMAVSFVICLGVYFAVNQFRYERNCERSAAVLTAREYHFGVCEGAVQIWIYDGENGLISFDRIYPVQIERIWDSEKLFVFQYHQRRYVVKKQELQKQFQLRRLLGIG